MESKIDDTFNTFCNHIGKFGHKQDDNRDNINTELHDDLGSFIAFY